MTCATLSSTAWAEAPGQVAVTRTCGGTMSGNCATGRAVMASRPAMVMTVETTKASRGRRMNSDESVMALPLGLSRVGWRQGRRHRHALADALLALDDDLLAGLQPVG